MKHWVIAPMESTIPDNLFQNAWQHDKQHGTIAAGWPVHTQHGTIISPAGVPPAVRGQVSPAEQLAHVDSYETFEDFQAHFDDFNEECQLDWGPRAAKIVWEFHREIQIGDKVIARHGLSKILGIGTVTKTAYYDWTQAITRLGISLPVDDADYFHVRPRFIEVSWEHTGEFPIKLAWRRSVQEITSEQFHDVLAKLNLEAAPAPELTPPTPETRQPHSPVTESSAPVPTKPSQDTSRPRMQAPTFSRPMGPRAILPQGSLGTEPRTTSPTMAPSAPTAPAHPNYYIGIDLGTTNSVMGWGTLNPQTNKLEPKVVEINMMIERGGMGKKELLPSCVYFKESSPPIVGEYAKTMIGRQTSRVVKSVKSEMGTPKQYEFDDNTYSASEISSQILTHLAASAKTLFGFVPEDVVITVPASFDSDMRAATVEAARLAGFRTHENDGSPLNILLDEPRAALYDFINRQDKGEIPETLINFHAPKLVLVFDLGGGTLDVSLHRVSYEHHEFRLNIEDLAVSRYTQIGGDDFDQKLADHFFDAYANRLPNNLDEFQMNLLKSNFREYAEQAKIDLSSEIETSKLMGHFDADTVETMIMQTPFENQVFQYDLTLSEYEDIVEPLLANQLTLDSVSQLDTLPACDNIIYPILDVLRKGERKLGTMPQVDAVLLNGGMTKLHPIQKRLEKFFGFAPITAGDADKAVARGAVVYHYDLHRGIKPARILNDTIGIEIAGGRVKPLVEAGTILPLSEPQPIEGLQVSDGAPSLRLPFYLGSRQDTKPPNRRILERNVRFRRPLLKNEPIYLQVQVDERGIMNVEGWPRANPNERFAVSVDSTRAAGTAPEAGSRPAAETSNVQQPRFNAPTHSPAPRGPAPAPAPTPAPASRPSGAVSPRPMSSVPSFRPAAPSEGTTLDVQYEIAEMKKNFSYYMRTYQINRKKTIMDQVIRQRQKISHATNAEEFIGPLLENIPYVNNYGKARVMVLLGDLASKTSDIDRLYDICDAAIALSNPDELGHKHPQVIKTVVRYAVEAIGKTGLPIAESHLINLITRETPIAVRPNAVYSIGKCCHSVNAVEHLKQLIEYGVAADRIAINWAFGKMGSREHEQPLPIGQLESVIHILMEQLRSDAHKDVKRNGIYALGEICDRRDCANDPIAVEKTAEVIAVLEPYHLFRTDGSLTELANLQQERMLKRFAGVSLNMIRGVRLSAEQETSLLTIRNE